MPDVLLEAHSASLQMTFYDAKQFPEEYRGSAFAAEHGSWNRAKRTGYKVIRIPLKDGAPTGEYQDFVTGFVTVVFLPFFPLTVTFFPAIPAILPIVASSPERTKRLLSAGL